MHVTGNVAVRMVKYAAVPVVDNVALHVAGNVMGDVAVHVARNAAELTTRTCHNYSDVNLVIFLYNLLIYKGVGV